MIKNLLVSLALLFTAAITAQNGTSSIYSFYGIGDVTFKGSLENRMMGGVSVFSDSTHINLQNPASFADLKLTSFTIGATNRQTDFKTNEADGKGNRSSLDYLAFAVPVSKKLGASFGLMPYSSVGYRIQSLASNNGANTSSRYVGEGGLNKVYFAAGYKLTPKINVGLDVNYNFGEITTSGVTIAEGSQYGSQEQNGTRMSGFALNAGLMYKSKLKNKMDVYGSFVYTPQMNLSLVNTRNLSTILYSDDRATKIEEQDIEAADIDMKMPSKISFGGGIGIERKWLLGTEITFTQANGYANRFDDITNGSFENGYKIGVGGYFIPNYNSFTSYFKRIVYRGGLRYEKTGLVVQNPVTLESKSIMDMAATVGLGFPLRGTFSNINIGFEIGKRGTKAAGLVEENYKNVSVSLSLNDQWFVRRKYD